MCLRGLSSLLLCRCWWMGLALIPACFLLRDSSGISSSFEVGCWRAAGWQCNCILIPGGNPVLITSVMAGMGRENSSADGNEQGWRACGSVWPSTRWRTEANPHKSADTGPSQWFWSAFMDKHSPSARWKQKFQWRELLLRALKPKNIYFRKIPELAVIFHILSFFFEARGQLWQSLWADPLSWFWLYFCLALVHRMSNYLHPGCLPGQGMGQKYSRAGATTCVACFHWPDTAAQSKPVVPKLLAWSGSRQGASCRQWLFWLRKHFVPSAADLLLSRPSVQPLLEKRNCSLCSLSCVWPSCHLGRPAALFLACTSISTASGNYPTHLS